jgi:hypothetical protein
MLQEPTVSDADVGFAEEAMPACDHMIGTVTAGAALRRNAALPIRRLPSAARR